MTIEKRDDIGRSLFVRKPPRVNGQNDGRSVFSNGLRGAVEYKQFSALNVYFDEPKFIYSLVMVYSPQIRWRGLA